MIIVYWSKFTLSLRWSYQLETTQVKWDIWTEHPISVTQTKYLIRKKSKRFISLSRFSLFFSSIENILYNICIVFFLFHRKTFFFSVQIGVFCHLKKYTHIRKMLTNTIRCNLNTHLKTKAGLHNRIKDGTKVANVIIN